MHLEGIVAGRRGYTALVVLALCECVAWRASAQEEARNDAGAATGSAGRAPAQQAAAAGAFSSWTTTARSDTQRATAHVTGGYDGASRGATFEGGAEAQLANRVGLRATGSSSSPGGSAPGGSNADGRGFGLRVEGKLDALREESDGVDLAIAGGYESRGFNEVPAVAGTLAIGRSLGGLRLLANVGYARGAREAEQYGSAGVAGIYQVSQQLHLGLDSRLRIDLERDGDEPPGEREWELLAGPTATFSLGSFALIGGTGVAVNRLRLQPGLNMGAIGYVGLGAAF